ncbi:M28 family peptidase [Zhouia amylolytica]|uniref:Vacuolar membrane protease n=1 Tax=Zhouia amylolytica AD3 TaxID=1286632 RepID=W2UIH4_9FLAO|nr:M28 family peptidase [Zhouia amylolytica]ETN93744.1 peptidase m28 [Zhouia amylolytica AD3]
MKNLSAVFSFFLIVLATYWSFHSLMPQSISKSTTPDDQFSTERALSHVLQISKEPHFVGAANHKVVRDYIVTELQKLGLKVELQEGYTGGDWGNLSKATNIISKIEGTGNGRSLVLMTHYDSNPHSSLGASDAGSGVAAILEGVRAYLATDKKPLNDIIILITDAEELGLNGAQLFVNEHPWTENIGVILNFEARGSGGPSYMLMETNGSNSKLIEHFVEADPEFPVANSLAYSIYKKLPNDTDLTVFREDADIDGFNFAFIDDHFDYHTAMDNYERLDRNTLEHQGSYLMPLLNYFSQENLSDLKSDTDFVFFNVPFFKMVTYPFSWILPMLILSVLVFIGLIIAGIRSKKIVLKEVGIGFLAFVAAVALSALIGFYAWPLLKGLYPQYNDILHGFTYNGHSYIAFFAMLSIAICFGIYSRIKEVRPVNLLVAPILFWLVICGYVAFNLEGASFFIIPVIAALVSFGILLRQEKPSILLLTLLAIPGLFILAPFVQMFPVALGLKILIASSLLTVLIFGLSLSVFGFYKSKKTLAIIFFIIAIFYFGKAHVHSGFDENRPNPTSLVYLLDADANKATWNTYNTALDSWTSKYITDDRVTSTEGHHFSSKYKTGFTYSSEAPVKNIDLPDIRMKQDTVINNERHVKICITPHRHVNRLELFSSTPFIECHANGIVFDKNYLKNRGDRLLTHYISHNEDTELYLVSKVNEPIEITLYESSNDLLNGIDFNIPQRASDAIPMPFVLNDAIIIKKTIRIE